MIHSIIGKTYITDGIVTGSDERINEYWESLKIEKHTLTKRDTHFNLNDENILCVKMGGTKYPLTLPALSNLCRILKLPLSYINKTVSSELTEKIINEAPIKKDGQWDIILYHDSENEIDFVAGIREGEVVNFKEMMHVIQMSGVFSSNDLEIVQYTHSVNVSGIYGLSQKTYTYDKDIKFDYRFGIALFFSESSDLGFFAHYYYEVKMKNALGEVLTFDFLDKKPVFKVSGKTNIYTAEVQKFLGDFEAGIISDNFENMIYLLRASITSGEISYFLLKKARSAARRAFSAKLLGDSFKEIDLEIIPEYNEFRIERKEQLKEMPAFMSNNLKTNFFFPLYYHRLYNFPATVENPDSFYKTKQSVFDIMHSLAESINIGNIS